MGGRPGEWWGERAETERRPVVVGSGRLWYTVIEATRDHLTLGGQKKTFSGVAFEFSHNSSQNPAILTCHPRGKSAVMRSLRALD